MTRQNAPQGAPNDADLRYLRLLSKDFPTRQAAFTEVINLEAILNLPKGTEHFMSDVHGEYEAFEHILNNCSGVIRERGAPVLRRALGDRPCRPLHAHLLPQGEAPPPYQTGHSR